MKANLYRGEDLVGSLELGGRKPYSIRVTYSLSGAIVELGAGLERTLVGPSAVTEVYHRQVTLNVGTRKETISYHLADTIGPAEPKPQSLRPAARSKPRERRR